MAKRPAASKLQKVFARAWGRMARNASHAASAAVGEAMKKLPLAGKKRPAGPKSKSSGSWSAGMAVSAYGTRRYRLFTPPGVKLSERLPLMVMLHGCGQNAESFAQASRMNRLAARGRFVVLYPEQERVANTQNCWNWFDTRSGRAQREADSIDAAIKQVCRLYPIDPQCIALAGLSAGAGMAALMAVRHPGQYRALAMHAGVAPGLAHSSATAVAAMRGRRFIGTPLPTGVLLPPLLVIQGTNDHVVAPGNGKLAATMWAAQCEARSSVARTIRRGVRHPMTITDFRLRGRTVATLCEIDGLGHAWSGGAGGQLYSDPKGPDASAMIWSFAKKQFASKG